MNNNDFIGCITKLYEEYINSHRRSSKKLLPLHGSISKDLQDRLGEDYIVRSLGFNENREAKINGRYFNKKVDISVFKKDGNNEIALGGIAVKSIMTNYSQNSNNYFENMLGETANIRGAEKLYFQLLILPEYLPYFGEKKINGVKVKDIITNIEHISNHNLEKYLRLSNDNVLDYVHSPNKTLIYLINITDRDLSETKYKNRDEWIEYLKTNLHITESQQNLVFGNSIIYNNYEKYIDKIAHAFLAL